MNSTNIRIGIKLDMLLFYFFVFCLFGVGVFLTFFSKFFEGFFFKSVLLFDVLL